MHIILQKKRTDRPAKRAKEGKSNLNNYLVGEEVNKEEKESAEKMKARDSFMAEVKGMFNTLMEEIKSSKEEAKKAREETKKEIKK